MSLKLKRSLIMIVTLFLGGILVSYIGFTKGRDMAVSLSRPAGATAWTTSNDMVIASTYIPVIAGVALIILAISFSIVIFARWFDKFE